MTRRLAFPAVLVALVAASGGGCAAAGPSAAPPSSPAASSAASSPAPPEPSAAGTTSSTNSTDPPVDRRPSGPPREPTDKIKKTSWVVGTVTTGGSGPCYSLIADDGTRYALHGDDGTELVKGTRMRVQTQTALVRIYCGPGKLVEMVSAETVR